MFSHILHRCTITLAFELFASWFIGEPSHRCFVQPGFALSACVYRRHTLTCSCYMIKAAVQVRGESRSVVIVGTSVMCLLWKCFWSAQLSLTGQNNLWLKIVLKSLSHAASCDTRGKNVKSASFRKERGVIVPSPDCLTFAVQNQTLKKLQRKFLCAHLTSQFNSGRYEHLEASGGPSCNLL